MQENNLIETIQEVSSFSKVFQVIIKQNRNLYSGMESDWLHALQFYLNGYAYERQGRSPDYPVASVEAVEQAKNGGQQPGSEFPRQAWEYFLNILNFPLSGKGGNPPNNPLFPSENEVKKSATQIILELEDHQYNLVRKVVADLKDGKVEKAHTFLCRIRGTGNKINSMFLRDIALMHQTPDQDYLLQPVDVWVRRLIRLVNSLPPDVSKGEKDNLSTDLEIANNLIDLSNKAGVSPLAFNQGAWYFGSQIAGSKYELIRCMKDKLARRKPISRKVHFMEEEIKALRGFTFQH